jgi:hypothetical protein
MAATVDDEGAWLDLHDDTAGPDGDNPYWCANCYDEFWETYEEAKAHLEQA